MGLLTIVFSVGVAYLLFIASSYVAIKLFFRNDEDRNDSYLVLRSGKRTVQKKEFSTKAG